MTYDVFISYSKEDREQAIALRDKMEAAGERCFLPPKEVLPGQDFAEEVRLALITCRALCLLATPRSLDSEWVATEWGAAWANGKPVIPILLQCAVDDLPERLRRIQCVDYHDIPVLLDAIEKAKAKKHGLAQERRVSFEGFMQSVGDVCALIRDDERFQPTVVVSVGRAGAVAGGVLAGNLGGLRFLGIDRVVDRAGDQQDNRKSIVPDVTLFKSYLEAESVLLVMAECHEGQTLREAKRALLNVTDQQHLRTACLFRSATAGFHPDYVGVNNAQQFDFDFRLDTWIRHSKWGV